VKLSEKGFTLIELIIVMSLISIIAAFVSMFFVYDVDMYTKLTNNAEGLQTSRIAMQRISTELRQIMSADSIQLASATEIRFIDSNDSLIYYNFSGDKIYRNNTAMLNSVSEFQLSYFNASDNQLSVPVADPTEIMTIDLAFKTTLDAQEIDYNTTILPRNF
jgi:prepilin-type N-terminal cleavage/methylation domain-containing protein